METDLAFARHVTHARAVDGAAVGRTAGEAHDAMPAFDQDEASPSHYFYVTSPAARTVPIWSWVVTARASHPSDSQLTIHIQPQPLVVT